MALLKKRKINEDEFIYSDNVGIQWQALFESGKIEKFRAKQNAYT